MKTLGQLIEALQAKAQERGGQVPVRLIVGGVAYPVDDVWWEPRQEGDGAVCVGDDPR